MFELAYAQVFIFITIAWMIARAVVAAKTRRFSVLRELQLLLVYICLVVIARFVYFPYRLVDGRIDTVTIGIAEHLRDMVRFIPFYFLVDRYGGWQRNIIGNIAMFLPVGLVWPICFKKLDSIGKVILAGAGLSLLIEVTQLLCVYRHSDIDDIILNTTGAAIGALIIFAIRRGKKSSAQKV